MYKNSKSLKIRTIFQMYLTHSVLHIKYVPIIFGNVISTSLIMTISSYKDFEVLASRKLGFI